jgi:hypothetical protein
MITLIGSILAFALLFALAAGLRPPRSCGGSGENCGSCGAACNLLESNHEQH